MGAGLSVTPEYRGLGIAVELLKARYNKHFNNTNWRPRHRPLRIKDKWLCSLCFRPGYDGEM